MDWEAGSDFSMSRPSTPGASEFPSVNFSSFVIDGQLAKRVRDLESEVRQLRGIHLRRQFVDREFPADNHSLWPAGAWVDSSDSPRRGVETSNFADIAGIAVMKKEMKPLGLWPGRERKTKKGWGGAGLLKKLKANQRITWRRAHELISDTLDFPNVFSRSIVPADVVQGDLGNCWFTSAVAALAEYPSLIQRLFVTKEYNKEGKYVLRLCKGGVWTDITVDDYFPASSDNRTPLYMKSRKHGELWAMLLEKAFAKMHGTYHALKSGYPHEALMDLTGCPFDYIKVDFQDPQVLWETLLGYDCRGYIMAASCRHNEDRTAIGLATGHSYSLLSVVEAAGNRLLKIRNPWGNFVWKGAWSQDDGERWTPAMKRSCAFSPHDAEEGTFWIGFEDFVLYFKKISVCMHRPEWAVVQAHGSWAPPEGNTPEGAAEACQGLSRRWVLRAERDCDLYIGLRQSDPRSTGGPPPLPAGIDVYAAGGEGEGEGEGAGEGAGAEGGGGRGAPVLPHLTASTEVFEQRGLCTPSRQNQVEVEVRAGRDYIVSAHCAGGSLLAREQRPFVLTVHAEDVAVTLTPVEDDEGTAAAGGWEGYLDALKQRALVSEAEEGEVLAEAECAPDPSEVEAVRPRVGIKAQTIKRPCRLVAVHERCRTLLLAINEADQAAVVEIDCSASTHTSSLLGELGMRCAWVPPGGCALLNVLLRDKIWGEAKWECAAEFTDGEGGGLLSENEA